MDEINLEIENEKRKIKQQELVTQVKKEKFIKEVKNGLGEVIKNELNTVHKKPNFFQRLKGVLFK